MGQQLLDVIRSWQKYPLSDSIYVARDADVSGATVVDVVSHEDDPAPSRDRYLIGIEQIRDIVEGLTEFFGAEPTSDEAVRSVLYYAENDAFLDPSELRGS